MQIHEKYVRTKEERQQEEQQRSLRRRKKIRSRRGVFTKHMRKRVVPLVRRSLIHLEQPIARIPTPRRPLLLGRSVTATVAIAAAADAAALPADSAALKDLPAPIEQHVELGIADDPALLARGRALHDLDVFALELEQLRGHLRDRLLPCLAGLAAPADGALELA
jgi:hypothetical protein